MVMTPRHIVMTMGPVAVAIIPALILSFVIPYWSPAICFDATSPSVRCRRWPSARRQSRYRHLSAGLLFGTVSASLITVSSITQNVFSCRW